MDDYRQIIGLIARACGYKDILELGCEKFGATQVIHQLNPDATIVCVDTVKRALPPKWCRFVNKTTDDFFYANTAAYDLVFVDADHSAESAAKDIENAIMCLNPGGTIVVHDTDPISEKYTAPDQCGDSWRMLAGLRDTWQAVTLPVENTGLTIIRRAGDTRVERWMSK